MVFHPWRNSFSGCFAIVFLLWLVVMATAGLWMWEIGNAFLMRGRLYKEPPPILDIKAESQYDARHYHLHWTFCCAGETINHLRRRIEDVSDIPDSKSKAARDHFFVLGGGGWCELFTLIHGGSYTILG